MIRRDTPHLSVSIPNMGKYGPEKLRIRTLFMQWQLLCTQSAITCSKLTIETPEVGVKYIQS